MRQHKAGREQRDTVDQLVLGGRAPVRDASRVADAALEAVGTEGAEDDRCCAVDG